MFPKVEGMLNGEDIHTIYRWLNVKMPSFFNFTKFLFEQILYCFFIIDGFFTDLFVEGILHLQFIRGILKNA